MGFRSSRCLLPYLLKERRLTARELAEITGISETTISQYANNHMTMSLDTAKTIAEALMIPIDDLYTWTMVHPSVKSRRKPKQ